MRHLGDLAAAFVDDRLDAGARVRVLRHLGGCARCSAEVEAQRQVKERLCALRPPAVPDRLAERLVDLPAARAREGAPDAADVRPGAADPAGPGGGEAVGVSHAVAAGAPAKRRPSAPGLRPPAQPATGGGPPGKPGSGGSRRGTRRRTRRIVLGSASALAVATGVFGVAFAVGGAPRQGPAVSPPVPAYVAKHASVSNDVPLSDPALTTLTSTVLP